MAKDFSKAKASNTLKSVAEKSKMLSNTKVIVKLPIDKLIDHPDNEYLFGMKQEDIDHMAEGIAQNGFKDPIEVYDNQDGTYMIYSGHIRKYGAIKNGMTEIDAIVYDKPEENVIRRELLGANLFGRNRIDNSDPILVARQLEYHTETLHIEGFLGNRRKQVAKEFGFKSDANVHKYVALLSLIPELQKKVSERAISYSGISTAAQMTEEEQKQLNAMLDQRLDEDSTVTRTELENIIREIRNGGKEQEIKGQMDVTDYPEVLPKKEKNTIQIDDSRKEPVIEEETVKDMSVLPQEEKQGEENYNCNEDFGESEESGEYADQVEEEESIKDDDKDNVSLEVVHREQPKPAVKLQQKKESEENKDGIADVSGGMMDFYIKKIERLFEEYEVINYENMEDILGRMKIVKMMLEDEIDRLSDMVE